MRCKECGAELPDGVRFCYKCGANLEKTGVVDTDAAEQSCQTESAEREKIVCIGCGAELTADLKFCKICGTKVGEKPIATDKPSDSEKPTAVKPKSKARPKLKTEKSEEPNAKLCPSCGAKRPPEYKFCNLCGASITDAEFVRATAKEIAPIPAEPDNAKICQNCGAKRPIEYKFCNLCGASITDAELVHAMSNEIAPIPTDPMCGVGASAQSAAPVYAEPITKKNYKPQGLAATTGGKVRQALPSAGSALAVILGIILLFVPFLSFTHHITSMTVSQGGLTGIATLFTGESDLINRGAVEGVLRIASAAYIMYTLLFIGYILFAVTHVFHYDKSVLKGYLTFSVLSALVSLIIAATCVVTYVNIMNYAVGFGRLISARLGGIGLFIVNFIMTVYFGVMLGTYKPELDRPSLAPFIYNKPVKILHILATCLGTFACVIVAVVMSVLGSVVGMGNEFNSNLDRAGRIKSSGSADIELVNSVYPNDDEIKYGIVYSTYVASGNGTVTIYVDNYQNSAYTDISVAVDDYGDIYYMYDTYGTYDVFDNYKEIADRSFTFNVREGRRYGIIVIGQATDGRSKLSFEYSFYSSVSGDSGVGTIDNPVNVELGNFTDLPSSTAYENLYVSFYTQDYADFEVSLGGSDGVRCEVSVLSSYGSNLQNVGILTDGDVINIKGLDQNSYYKLELYFDASYSDLSICVSGIKNGSADSPALLTFGKSYRTEIPSLSSVYYTFSSYDKYFELSVESYHYSFIEYALYDKSTGSLIDVKNFGSYSESGMFACKNGGEYLFVITNSEYNTAMTSFRIDAISAGTSDNPERIDIGDKATFAVAYGQPYHMTFEPEFSGNYVMAYEISIGVNYDFYVTGNDGNVYVDEIEEFRSGRKLTKIVFLQSGYKYTIRAGVIDNGAGNGEFAVSYGNFTRDTAIAISMNTVVNLAFNSVAYFDRNDYGRDFYFAYVHDYSFDLRVFTEGSTNPGDSIAILDSDGYVVESTQNSAFGEKTLELSLDPDENYYIRISKADAESAFSVYVTDANEEMGSSFITAVAVSANVGYLVNFESGDAYYKFTPNVGGAYCVMTLEYSGDPDLKIYNAVGELIDEDTSLAGFDVKVNMSAGNTYYLVIKAYGVHSECSCSLMVADSEMSALIHSAEPVAVGDLYNFTSDYWTVLGTNLNIVFKFTPFESGVYSVSANPSGTKIYIKDGVWKNINIYGDGSGYTADTVHMEKDKTYYIVLQRSNVTDGSFSVMTESIIAYLPTVAAAVNRVGIFSQIYGSSEVYEFTAQATRDYIVRLTDISGYPMLYIYDSEHRQLTPENTADGEYTVPLIKGRKYYFEIYAAYTGVSSGKIEITDGMPTGESRDDAILLVTEHAYVLSLSSGECRWYKFTPAIDGSYTIATTGSFTGDPDFRLYEWASNNALSPDTSGGGFDTVVSVSGGVTYYLEVFSGTSGSSEFAFSVHNPDATAESRDSAIGLMLDASVTASVKSSNRTNDVSDAVWYSFTPVTDGTYRIYTPDTAYDTDLYVFVGNSDSVADDSWKDLKSGAFNWSHTLTAGTTYYIAIVGFKCSPTITFTVTEV